MWTSVGTFTSENRFVDLFHYFVSFVRSYLLPLFALKRSLCDLTLPLVQTVGPEVFRGNFDCAGEQNCRIRLGVGFLQSYLSVPPNLAASLDVRKRSDVMTVSKKKERGTCTFVSPRVRSDPLRLLGPDVTGDRSEGSELYSCIRTYPLLRILTIIP